MGNDVFERAQRALDDAKEISKKLSTKDRKALKAGTFCFISMG